jgi:hypothetical protein
MMTYVWIGHAAVVVDVRVERHCAFGWADVCDERR